MPRYLFISIFAFALAFVACDDDSSSDDNNVNNTNSTAANNANNTNNLNNTTVNNQNNLNNANNTTANNQNNLNNPQGEVCDNGTDDDDDGIADCLDADCALTAICAESHDRLDLSDKEFEVFLFTNMARTDPKGFAATYLTGGGDNGAHDDLMGRSPVSPLALHVDLIAAARAHSTDMATDCGMQHDSCDGTSWDQRIHSYYSGGTIAENIAAGYPTGEAVVLGWIIDQGVASLGHRVNILNGSYAHIGIGESNNYWTQDFGSGGK